MGVGNEYLNENTLVFKISASMNHFESLIKMQCL